jgi:hypothetical protein
MSNNTLAFGGRTQHSNKAAFVMMAALVAMAAIGGAEAATTAGDSLKAAYDTLNGLSAGYGKQLVVLVGFIATAFGMLASQATGPVLKFMGVVIFLAVGLGAGITLSGGLI